ncbi:DUF3114 domain-containing protein [Lactococcus chungangensis]|uniref:DUF3114 domain-containing protein n=1 Tax=Pseudolactococcus chungangensis TaxID=451457 RepID=UPI0028D3F2F4|nr:DUF3114 domain-containing protein [Lactococcus chungangensis]
MGIKYSQSESKELMKKLLANVAVADNITSRLSKGSSHLQQVVGDKNSGLSGAAYTAGADLFSKIDTLIQKYNAAVADVRSDVQAYQTAEMMLNGEPAIDETVVMRILDLKNSDLRELEEQLRTNQQFLSSQVVVGAVLEAWLLPYNQELSRQIEQVKEAIRHEEERLKRLHQFVSQVSSLFTDSVDAFNLAFKGISVFNQTRVDSAGYAYYPTGSDMKWLSELEENEFGSYSVTRPKNMSDADFADYVEKVNKQAKTLENEHWGKAGVASYLKYLDENVANFDNPLVEVDTAYKRLHMVGSDVFTFVIENAYPYDAKNPTFSKEQCAKETLDMVYAVLGAKIDSNNFLQLDNVMNGKYHFPIEKKDVEQYFKFADSYSNLIQVKYAGKDFVEADYTETEKKIDHQMRYWLDKPIVDYINNGLPVGEGETKASAYLKWLEEMGIVAGNPAAGYHNRTLNREREPHPKNEKITAEHIEIIFTHDCNNTVSMWNHLEKDDTGLRYDTDPERYRDDYQNIANTDSANYANPKIKNGKFVNSGEQHDSLDVEFPAYCEPDLRKKSKKDYDRTPPYKTDLKKVRGGK